MYHYVSFDMKIILYLFKNYSKIDTGLLTTRIVFGFFMIYNHGYGKIIGGPEKWERLGGVLTDLIGMKFLQTFFGLMASLSESLFSLFIIFGLFTRLSSFFLGFTMSIATLKHLLEFELPEMAIIYLTFSTLIIFSGPGKYSLDNFILKKFN